MPCSDHGSRGSSARRRPLEEELECPRTPGPCIWRRASGARSRIRSSPWPSACRTPPTANRGLGGSTHLHAQACASRSTFTKIVVRYNNFDVYAANRNGITIGKASGGGDQVNNTSLEDLMCAVGAGEGGLLGNRDIFMCSISAGAPDGRQAVDVIDLLLPTVFPDHVPELLLPPTLLNFARCPLLLQMLAFHVSLRASGQRSRMKHSFSSLS